MKSSESLENSQDSMEEVFIDPQKRRSIKTLYNHSHLIETPGLKRERFQFVLEKVDLMSLFQLRLVAATDQTEMLLCTIDHEIFERIKIEQAINVSYTGFIDYLLQILDGCRKDELFLAVIENQDQKFLQLYEKRPFKNLTHLFLPLRRASTLTALFHMNAALEQLQSQVSGFRGQIEMRTAEIATRDAQIHQLRREMQELRDTLREKDLAAFTRESDEAKRLHTELKNLHEAKEATEKVLKKEIRQGQDKFEKISRDLMLANERIEQEVKKQDLLKEEIARLRPFIQANHKLQLELDQSHAKEQRLEHKFVDLQRVYAETQEKLRQEQRLEQELQAEVEAERQIASGKRNALQLATEEISSANRIILQQSKELKKLKEKVEVRTELALKLEKVVQDRENEIEELKVENQALKDELQTPPPAVIQLHEPPRIGTFTAKRPEQERPAAPFNELQVKMIRDRFKH